MPRDAKKYLHDIAVACERVQSFLSGKNLDHYRTDDLLKSAVERQLSIAGEARVQLRAQFSDVAAKITDHRRITAFRNILIHGYSKVDSDIVWKVIQEDIPLLKKEVLAL